MAAYTVYIDQVFIGNLVINYVLLWAAAKLSRIPARKGRILTGAALGALYSLIMFMPVSHVLFSVFVKVTASVIIAAVAFIPVAPRKFLICLGCFYLTSFTLGGLIFGSIFFISQDRVLNNQNISSAIAGYFWPGVILGLAGLWGAGKGIAKLFDKKWWENIFKMILCIKYDGKLINIEALLDTGNSLKDPLTQNPVVVVEYHVIKSILPVQVQAFFENNRAEPDVWQILSLLSETRTVSRFSAVPFQSLGCANGLMLGFRPDEVLIEREGRMQRAGKVIIGIYHKRIDPVGVYHALLGPELLESA
jgi:stage II sporulation protein GA (sporulation sigma-E factor processing peptidase)